MLLAASSVHEIEHLLSFILLQLSIIVVFARFAGFVAHRLGQPRVIGEIIGGLLLGPSLLGRIAPDTFQFLFHSVPGTTVTIMSQIGLVFLMFQIGLEFDFSHLNEKRNRKAVLWVAAVGILLPFACGWLVGDYSAAVLAPGINPLGYKLFVATAMSITAVPILGRIMMEFGLTKKRLGAIAITSAAINDVVGWVLLAIVTSLTVSAFSTGAVLRQGMWIVIYTILSLWLVRPLFKKIIRRCRTESDPLPLNLVAIMIAAAFVSGLITYKLGIFAIFGGFMMGVLLFDEEGFVKAWNVKISPFITVFFLPIFFTYTGLRTNIHGLNSSELWGWCGVIIAAATIGKFAGCYFAARAAGLKAPEAQCIGIMMNTRALMELIILNVGYDLGVIPQNVFTMLVLMAVFTTVITSPLLRLWLPKTGHVIPPRADI